MFSERMGEEQEKKEEEVCQITECCVPCCSILSAELKSVRNQVCPGEGASLPIVAVMSSREH